MKTINLFILSVTIFLVWIWLANEQLSYDKRNNHPQSKGEVIEGLDIPGLPPANHKEYYHREFTLLADDYIDAIGYFDEFLQEDYYPAWQFHNCFNSKKLPCSPKFAHNGKKYLARFIVTELQDTACPDNAQQYMKVKIILTGVEGTRRADKFKERYEEKYSQLEQRYRLVAEDWNTASCSNTGTEKG